MLRGLAITMRRRDLLAGAGFLALAACTSAEPKQPRPPTQRDPTTPTSPPRVRVDPSFAEQALAAIREPGAREGLVDHPALAALLRHKRMSGGTSTEAELLDAVLGNVADEAGAKRVLAFWHGREALLGERVDAAAQHLPAGHPFVGTLFLVVGYDIGVATPPDIAINVAHPHFVAAPTEVGYYALHEAHHVGFMAERGTPPLDNLTQAASLRRLVQYVTQLEGMAVHAAYAERARGGALAADEDYAVYLDEREARRIIDRYGVVLAMIPETGSVEPPVLGAVLEAATSGERLAYRFGALVARQLEATAGRAGLIESIRKPQGFDDAARYLAGESR